MAYGNTASVRNFICTLGYDISDVVFHCVITEIYPAFSRAIDLYFYAVYYREAAPRLALVCYKVLAAAFFHSCINVLRCVKFGVGHIIDVYRHLIAC